MATDEPWKPATEPGQSAAGAGRPYHSADFAAGYSPSMLVATPPSQLPGPHLDALPRRGSLPSSLQPPNRAPWRESESPGWPQHPHQAAGKRPASPAADPASPAAKRSRLGSIPSSDTELRASGSIYNLPPRSSGEFQQGSQHQARGGKDTPHAPWTSHAAELQREPGGRGNAPPVRSAVAAGPEAVRQLRAPSEELPRHGEEPAEAEAPEDSSEPFEMKAQKPGTTWSEIVPTRVAHKVTKSFRVYSNAFIEGRVPGLNPVQHIESEAPINAGEEAAAQPLPSVTVPRPQRGQGEASPWDGGASYDQQAAADHAGGLSASASRLSRSTGQEWRQQPRQAKRHSPTRSQRDRTLEWARRETEAVGKPPAGVPDFEQWMADSRQQHLAEAGSLGVQGSSSDFLAAAQALQAQVQKMNPELNSAQRDLLQHLVSGAAQSPSRAAAEQPRSPEGGPADGPPSLVRSGGMLGAPRGTSGSSFAAPRASSTAAAAAQNVLGSSPAASRPPAHQRIIVHGRGQGIGTSSDEAAQKAARDFVPDADGGYTVVRRSRYAAEGEAGWVDRSLPSMASSEMTAFPPLPRPVQPHTNHTMQSGPSAASGSFRPNISTPDGGAAEVPGVKPEEGAPQADGQPGEGGGQLSEVARQLPVPLVQQLTGAEGLAAAAAAANKLATSMAPVSVRGADDRMAAETLISLISLGGEPASVPVTTAAMVPPPPRPPPAKGANSSSPPARPSSAQRPRPPKRVEGMHPILGIAVPHARRTSLHPTIPGAAPVTAPLETPPMEPIPQTTPQATPQPPPEKAPTPVASPSVTQSTEDDLPHIAAPLRKRSPSITSMQEAGTAAVVQPADAVAQPAEAAATAAAYAVVTEAAVPEDIVLP